MRNYLYDVTVRLGVTLERDEEITDEAELTEAIQDKLVQYIREDPNTLGENILDKDLIELDFHPVKVLKINKAGGLVCGKCGGDYLIYGEYVFARRLLDRVDRDEKLVVVEELIDGYVFEACKDDGFYCSSCSTDQQQLPEGWELDFS